MVSTGTRINNRRCIIGAVDLPLNQIQTPQISCINTPARRFKCIITYKLVVMVGGPIMDVA